MGVSVDTLVVVGAGPKAMAVAAKAAVLRRLGMPAPRVVVVESHAVGGMAPGRWLDRRAASPRHEPGEGCRVPVSLGVGARPEPGDRRGDDGLQLDVLPGRARHLRRMGGLAGGPARTITCGPAICSGSRPAARSKWWPGTVRRIAPASDGWLVTVDESGGGTAQLDADGLLVTGPGSSGRALAEHPKVLSIAGSGSGRSPRAAGVLAGGGDRRR